MTGTSSPDETVSVKDTSMSGRIGQSLSVPQADQPPAFHLLARGPSNLAECAASDRPEQSTCQAQPAQARGQSTQCAALLFTAFTSCQICVDMMPNRC